MAFSDSSPSVSPAEDRVLRRAGDRNPDAVELYKVIYGEALRLLKDQLDELAAVRTRTVQYLALVGTATAFLVGTSLGGGSRDDAFVAVGAVASVLFISTLLSGMQVLTGFVRQVPGFHVATADKPAQGPRRWHVPRLNFHFSAEALSVLADNPVEVGQDKYYGQAALLKRLALDAEKYHDENERFIRLLKKSYQRCIALGFVQLLVWGAVAWRYGGAAS